MSHLTLLMLVLNAGVITGPFRIAEAEPGHHQVCLQAAMRDDGSFAVAWVDSLRIIEGPPPYQISETDIYVRFFNPQGEPLSDAYKIPKAVDTNWVFEPCLDMDSAGNTILVWHEAPIRLSAYRDIRYQRFNFGAVPASQPKTLKDEMWLSGASYKPIHADLNQKGEIALAWSQIVWDSFFRQQVWIQRFNCQGEPLDTAFMAHKEKSERYDYVCPRVALNDDGYVVVTWLDLINSSHMFPLFQAFTPDDEPLYPGDTMGRRIDENPDTVYWACRPEPHWLDNERFVLFWPCIDFTNRVSSEYGLMPELSLDMEVPGTFMGRVFSNRGLTSYPERILVHNDSLGSAASTNPHGQYCTKLYGDNFVFTSPRMYYNMDDPFKPVNWNHCGGIIGEVADNEPMRRTTYFEYTPEWYPDTMNCFFDYFHHPVAPAVACNENRIVWVYPRLNQDTIFEAYVLITDWNMGIGVVERPPVTHLSNWQITSSIGRQIVLRYSNHPQGFNASIFDASGRKVDELHAPLPLGTISWGQGYESGVYFIRDESDSPTTHKVILIQ